MKTGCATCKYVIPFSRLLSGLVTHVIRPGAELVSFRLSRPRFALDSEGRLHLAHVSIFKVLSGRVLFSNIKHTKFGIETSTIMNLVIDR